MDKQSLRNLFTYHYWANRRLWRSIMALSDAQFTQPLSDGGPSIQAQVVGMVANENLWVNYLWHNEVEFLNESYLPTRASIRAEWDALEEEMRDFIDVLTPIELETQVDPEFMKLDAPMRVWEILAQIVDQAAEHRTHLCCDLNDFGSPVPDRDIDDIMVTHWYAIPA